MAVRFKGFSSRKFGKTLYNEELIKQDIMNVLNMRKGELPMNPDLGFIVHDIIHDPLTDFNRSLIVDDLNRILSLDPRISVLDVNVEEKNNGYEIRITVRYVHLDREEELFFHFERTNLS